MARHGENIRKRKDGRWEGRYLVQNGNGKKIYRSIYGKTYCSVKEGLERAKKELDPDRFLPLRISQNASVKLAAEEWLCYVAQNNKYSTYIKYSSVCKKYLFPIYKEESPQEITGIINGITGILNNSSLSASLKKSIVCVANQIFLYGSTHYGLPEYKFKVPDRKGNAKPVEVLSKTEQTKLFRYLYTDPDIFKVGIIICLSTGLRLGELCSLKWEDIDFESQILCINRTVQRISVSGGNKKTVLMESSPKSMFSKREIPLTEELINLLLLYRNNGSYIFGKDNKPMEPRTFQNKLKKYMESSGIKNRNFHVLRHTFATNCVDNGIDVKCLSELLGHSNVQITLNRYVHPTMDTKRKYMVSLASFYGQYVGQKTF